MELGILLAFGAMISWGFSDFVTKISLNKAPKRIVIFFSTLTGATLALGLGVVLGHFSFSWTVELGYIVLLGVMNALGLWLWYYAMHEKGVALISPIISSWAVVTIPLGIVFFDERLTLLQIAAAAMIIGGILIMTLKGKLRMDRSFVYALLSMTIWGLFHFILKIPTAIFGAFLVVGGVKIITAGISYPRKEKLPNRTIPFLILVGFLEAAGFLAFAYATQLSPVSLIAPITAAVPLVAVALSVWFLGERLTRKQTAGVIVTILGAILITL